MRKTHMVNWSKTFGTLTKNFPLTLNIHSVAKNCASSLLASLLEMPSARGSNCCGKVSRYSPTLVTYDWGYALKVGRWKAVCSSTDDQTGKRETSLRRCRTLDMRTSYTSSFTVSANAVTLWDATGSAWNRGSLDCMIT